MDHMAVYPASTHPALNFIGTYIHQIDLAVIVAAMFYYIYRYHREMFAVFGNEK